MASKRATKLVCTIGPVSEDLLPDMVGAGMDVARVNLSHGSRLDHERMVKGVRDAAVILACLKVPAGMWRSQRPSTQ